MEKQEKNTATPYDLDGRPPLKLAIPLGLQHVLAMFVGNLTPLLIITAACGIEAGGELQVALLQNAMLVAGIATLIQLFPVWRIGSRLPIVMGVSFTFVTVLSIVAASYGYPAVIGAAICGGVFEGVIGLFAIGAGLGALLSAHMAERGIWVSCALLAVSFFIMFIREEEKA